MSSFSTEKSTSGTASMGANPNYIKPLLRANENGTADERYLYDGWEAMEEIAAKGCPPKYEIEVNVHFLQDPQNWARIADLLWQEAALRNLRDASFKGSVARKKAMAMIDDLWEGNREQWLPRLANYELPDEFVDSAKRMVYLVLKETKYDKRKMIRMEEKAKAQQAEQDAAAAALKSPDPKAEVPAPSKTHMVILKPAVPHPAAPEAEFAIVQPQGITTTAPQTSSSVTTTYSEIHELPRPLSKYIMVLDHGHDQYSRAHTESFLMLEFLKDDILGNGVDISRNITELGFSWKKVQEKTGHEMLGYHHRSERHTVQNDSQFMAALARLCRDGYEPDAEIRFHVHAQPLTGADFNGFLSFPV